MWGKTQKKANKQKQWKNAWFDATIFSAASSGSAIKKKVVTVIMLKM